MALETERHDLDLMISDIAKATGRGVVHSTWTYAAGQVAIMMAGLVFACFVCACFG